MPTVRLDHAPRFGQPLLVLVSFHAVQQVGFAGELDQSRMGGDQGLARGLAPQLRATGLPSTRCLISPEYLAGVQTPVPYNAAPARCRRGVGGTY